MPTADGSPNVPVVAPLVQIEQHAQTVRRLGERVDQAYGAARHVTLDADAYGVICAIIPLKLMPLQARIAATMHAAATDLQHRSQTLLTVAASYDSADKIAAARHDTITRGLPG